MVHVIEETVDNSDCFLFSSDESDSENILRKKKSHAEIAKMFNKNRSSICEIVMKEKEIHAPQTAK